MSDRILVIRFGDLVDFVRALPAMAQIRRSHPDAEITLLTTPSFESFAAASGLFNTVWNDGRPAGAVAWLALARRMRKARFSSVYDLQSSRTSANVRATLFGKSKRWIGAPSGYGGPTLERHWKQLVNAGIAGAVPAGATPRPDLAWTRAATRRNDMSVAERMGVTAPFAILVPGPYPGRPQARWPTKQYAALAATLKAAGLTPVIAGSPQEAGQAEAIQRHVPETVIVTGKVNPAELSALASDAAVTVGTNPAVVEVAAYAGSPTLMLLPSDIPPNRRPTANDRVTVLLKDDLTGLEHDEVMKACHGLLSRA